MQRKPDQLITLWHMMTKLQLMSMTGYGFANYSTQHKLCLFHPKYVLKFMKQSASKNTMKEIHTPTNDHSLSMILNLSQLAWQQPLQLSCSIYHQKSHTTWFTHHFQPIQTYLKSLPNGQTPDMLVVSKESLAPWSIFPLVDHPSTSLTLVHKLSQ